jgi:5'-3' exonuclease
MGIPGLFAWLKKNCPFLIRSLPSNKSLSYDIREPIHTLCLDMNGIFHEATQKVYEYGKYKKIQKLVGPPVPRPPEKVLQRKVFHEIAEAISTIIYRTQPSKRVLIMIDGTAGAAKQSQQKQRRYRAAADTERTFDSCSISPGTEFMDHLSKYLDFYFRKQVSLSPMWAKLQIIFSNDKVPGEGEHKLVHFVKKYGKANENFVFYGMDADLIMLTLITQNMLATSAECPKFFILREDQYAPGLFILNISGLREYLIQEYTWSFECSRQQLINDFVFICFLLGNDFLPHSPSIELIEGGLELILNTYKTICEREGNHLIGHDLKINQSVMKEILFAISTHEKSLILDSLMKADKFSDPLLNSFVKKSSPPSSIEEEKKEEAPLELKTELDFEGYRKEYYRLKFAGQSIEKICHQYIQGMDWVIQYYVTGMPSWGWHYPYLYAPFAKELCEHFESYKPQKFHLGRPMSPYLQLLTIIPPQSGKLLPAPFRELMEKENLKEYFPRKVEIDLAGKKYEWQATVLLPFPDLSKISQEYEKALPLLEDRDRRRNIIGKVFVYQRKGPVYVHKCYYGEFECQTCVQELV